MRLLPLPWPHIDRGSSTTCGIIPPWRISTRRDIALLFRWNKTRQQQIWSSSSNFSILVQCISNHKYTCTIRTLSRSYIWLTFYIESDVHLIEKYTKEERPIIERRDQVEPYNDDPIRKWIQFLELVSRNLSGWTTAPQSSVVEFQFVRWTLLDATQYYIELGCFCF